MVYTEPSTDLLASIDQLKQALAVQEEENMKLTTKIAALTAALAAAGIAPANAQRINPMTGHPYAIDRFGPAYGNWHPNPPVVVAGASPLVPAIGMIERSARQIFRSSNHDRHHRHRHGERTCPEGTQPAGKLGCVGETITDREVLKAFDEHIEHGCVPGATRTIWKRGVDPQGRPYRLRVQQHAVCD
jgi:hypothetical protein